MEIFCLFDAPLIINVSSISNIVRGLYQKSMIKEQNAYIVLNLQ